MPGGRMFKLRFDWYIISAKHSYYSEIQSPERYLPAGLNIHLQQQPISLFQLTKVRFGSSKEADTKVATRKFPPWPFAVLLKQTTPFTPNDGIMQHSDQTSISQSFYPNLWNPDGRNKCFREDLRKNFVPWDLTGQRYSPEHVLLHILYNNAS